MKILNFGSLNLDYVYEVNHMVQPGETLASEQMHVFCGGKGLNQSIALAKAGAQVYHAGLIGEEGEMLRQACEDASVDCRWIRTVTGQTGHAIIQVDPSGQNCILLFGGANQSVTSDFVDEVLEDFGQGDILLLQNEINRLPEIVDKAFSRGMFIVLNPSPFNDGLNAVDLEKIGMFILNEVEGEQLTGESDPDKILLGIRHKFPKAAIVLTLGADGALYQHGEELCRQEAYPVKAIDTTAAGDTFTGYFLASRAEGLPAADCLKLAAKAASIAVTRPGAVPSIPTREELNA